MRYTIFIFVLLAFFSCKQESSTSTDSSTDEGESFELFYAKFHSDSLYQMEHIVFPLPGLPSEVDSVTLAGGNFKWQKEDWKIHKDIGQNPEFKQEFSALTSDLIVERLTYEKLGNVGIIRRFAKVGGEWNLIYYAGLNYFEE